MSYKRLPSDNRPTTPAPPRSRTSQMSESWPSSRTLSTNFPEHVPRSDDSVYSFGIPSHLSWSPRTSENSTLVASTYKGTYNGSPPQPHYPTALASRDAHGTPAHLYPTIPPVGVHPALEQCILPGIDLMYAAFFKEHEPDFRHLPYMREKAFSVTGEDPLVMIRFPGEHANLAVKIEDPANCTITELLSQLGTYLACPMEAVQPAPYDTRYTTKRPSGYRSKSARPDQFHEGVRRLDQLGRQRMFMGLYQVNLPWEWVVQLGYSQT